MKGANKHAITFMDEDAGRVHHPHDDAIIITLLIASYTTRKVLVDSRYLILSRLLADEAWTRSISSSKCAFSGIWRNEGTTSRHYYSTCRGKSVSILDS